MDLNEVAFPEFHTESSSCSSGQKLLPPAPNEAERALNPLKHGLPVGVEILGCHYVYLMDPRTGDVIRKPIGACTPDAHLGATED